MERSVHTTPNFVPDDPEYEARVRSSFDRQAVMHTINASISAVAPGRIEIDFAPSEGLTQQHGFVHAGIIATVLDSACGYAAFSLMPVEAAVLTVEYKVNFLRPADADRFTVTGEVLKHGRTLSVCQGEAKRAGGGESVAVMVATVMAVIGGGIHQ